MPNKTFNFKFEIGDLVTMKNMGGKFEVKGIWIDRHSYQYCITNGQKETYQYEESLQAWQDLPKANKPDSFQE